MDRKIKSTMKPISDLRDADLDKIKHYTRIKHAIAEQIRLMRNFLEESGDQDGEADCIELMAKLAEDRFTLAVMGQFNRGKSTLMNALIGRDLLPTGILPLTSVITTLKFGPKERLMLHYSNSPFPEEVAVSELASYVSESGNPGNMKKIAQACLETPIRFLRSGFEFIDTPGVGSVIEENTLTTFNFIEKCDAAIVVTSAENPLTRNEADFLRRIRRFVSKIFFVVNKIDLVENQEVEELLGFTIKSLKEIVGSDELMVFPLSSRLGLEARLANDVTDFEKSGIGALEKELISFLSSEKTDIFLVSILDRVLRLTVKIDSDRYGASPESSSLGLAQNNRVEKLKRLKKKLYSLRREVRRESTEEEIEKSDARAQEIWTADNREPDAATHLPVGKLRVAETLTGGGCPICDGLDQSRLNFFAKWQHELASNEDVQRAFATHQGFCPVHTWDLASVSSPRGLSLGYPRLAQHISKALSKLIKSTRGLREGILELIHNYETCPVCQRLSDWETGYLREMAVFLKKEDGREAYARAHGVCLRHLGLLVGMVSNDISNFLISEAARHFEGVCRRHAELHDQT